MCIVVFTRIILYSVRRWLGIIYTAQTLRSFIIAGCSAYRRRRAEKVWKWSWPHVRQAEPSSLGLVRICINYASGPIHNSPTGLAVFQHSNTKFPCLAYTPRKIFSPSLSSSSIDRGTLRFDRRMYRYVLRFNRRMYRNLFRFNRRMSTSICCKIIG